MSVITFLLVGNLSLFGVIASAECATIQSQGSASGESIPPIDESAKLFVGAGGCLMRSRIPSEDINTGSFRPSGDIDIYIVNQLPSDRLHRSVGLAIFSSVNSEVQDTLERILSDPRGHLAYSPSLMLTGTVYSKSDSAFKSIEKGLLFGGKLGSRIESLMVVNPFITEQIFMHEYGHVVDDLSGRLSRIQPLAEALEQNLKSALGDEYMKSAASAGGGPSELNHSDLFNQAWVLAIELPAERFRYAFNVRNGLIDSKAVSSFRQFIDRGEYPGLKEKIQEFNDIVSKFSTSPLSTEKDKIYFARVCGFIRSSFLGIEFESDYRGMLEPCYRMSENR